MHFNVSCPQITVQRYIAHFQWINATGQANFNLFLSLIEKGRLSFWHQAAACRVQDILLI